MEHRMKPIRVVSAFLACAASLGVAIPAERSILPALVLTTASAALWRISSEVTVALFPVATADFFGNKNVGTNYGWVFLAYGVAGIAGPQVAGFFKDAAVGGDVSAWTTPFIIAGVACLIAAGISLALKAPKHD